MTLPELVASLERAHLDAQRAESDAEQKMKRMLTRANAEGRKTLSTIEESQLDKLTEDKRRASSEVTRIRGQIEGAQLVVQDESRLTTLESQTTSTNVRKPAYDAVVRVGADESTYRPPAHRGHGDPSFLHDLFAGQVLRDPGANGRLERHGREVEREQSARLKSYRAMGSTAVSGFVPPQYLAELFADYARAGRPTANLTTPMPLPEVGMQVTIPRLTTPTVASVQATEGGAIGNQDADDTLLSPNVVTIAGYVDVSRQAIERGVMVEEVLLGDLAADYNSKLDAQVINGTGLNGQHLGILGVSGINSVTYTDASPTIPEAWPKLADAVGRVVSARYTGATAIVVNPTFWTWLLAEKDSTGRPLVEPQAVAVNPVAISGRPDYAAVSVGSLFGVPVVLDGNVPVNLGGTTTETRVIAADFRDCFLFEDSSQAPAQLRFDEPLSSTLQIRLLAYGYSAFAAGRRPTGISVVSGTGLIVPAL